MANPDLTTWIRSRSAALGFAATGVAAIVPMDPAPLAQWLQAGYGAEMDYLRRHLPLRADLRAVLPGARSAICVALPYPCPRDNEPTAGRVAYYAQGEDYHKVVTEKLTQLWGEISLQVPDTVGRVFVDGGPLPERELARRAGIGWVGNNSCLIAPGLGTRFVLGEILTTLPLTPTAPIDGDCGNCNRCREACPTGAIVAPGVVDARRCLSYLTIEYRGPIPREFRTQVGTRLFGCDTCQDACPHNRDITVSSDALAPSPDMPRDYLPLLQITAAEFKKRFHGTALSRTKREGLLRNVCIVLGNLGDRAAIPALREALTDDSSLIRGHAAWALGRLRDHAHLQNALERESDPWLREEIGEAIR